MVKEKNNSQEKVKLKFIDLETLKNYTLNLTQSKTLGSTTAMFLPPEVLLKNSKSSMTMTMDLWALANILYIALYQ